MDPGRGSCRDAEFDEDLEDGPYSDDGHHDEDEASGRIGRFLCDTQAPLYRLHLASFVDPRGPSTSNQMTTLSFVAEAFPQLPAETAAADARPGPNYRQSRAVGPADGPGIDGPHMSSAVPVDWQSCAEQQAAIWGELFVIPDRLEGGPFAVAVDDADDADDADPGPLGTSGWDPEGGDIEYGLGWADAQFDLFEEQEEEGRSTNHGLMDGVCNGSAKCTGGR